MDRDSTDASVPAATAAPTTMSPTLPAVEPKPNGADATPVPSDPTKTSVFDLYAIDRDLERDGVWFTHPRTGMRFKIAVRENPAHMKVLSDLGPAALRAFQNGEMKREQTEQITARIVGYGLLRDWDDRFKEPFSHETATQLAARSPDWTNWVCRMAGEYDQYRMQAQETDSGN